MTLFYPFMIMCAKKCLAIFFLQILPPLSASFVWAVVNAFNFWAKIVSHVTICLSPTVSADKRVAACQNMPQLSTGQSSCHMSGVHQTIRSFIYSQKFLKSWIFSSSFPPSTFFLLVSSWMSCFSMFLSTSTIKQYNIKARIEATNYQIPLCHY